MTDWRQHRADLLTAGFTLQYWKQRLTEETFRAERGGGDPLSAELAHCDEMIAYWSARVERLKADDADRPTGWGAFA